MAQVIDDILSQLRESKPDFRIDLWEKEECYRFYVEQRRLTCIFTELMDLWLVAPYCTDCMQSDPLYWVRPPDISPHTWKEDLAWTVGEATLRQTRRQLRKNRGFAFLCKKCMRELRPWENHEVYVVRYHLEEHYGIPMETGAKKNPSKWIRDRVFQLYDFRCFGCKKARRSLHIDHIKPRSCRGDAAFHNLQPLCDRCGQKKGNSIPDEVAVYSDLYFGPYPSDAYEGLFW